MEAPSPPDDQALGRALAEAIPVDVADPEAPAREGVGRFVDWSLPFLHAWSHIRISAVAHRVGDRWIGRALVAVLVDHDGKATRISTQAMAAGSVTVPIAQLPALLADAWRGEIAAARNPFGTPLVLAERPGEPMRRYSSWSHQPSALAGEPCNHFHRYVLELYSSGGFAPFFAEQNGGYWWLERERPTFEALGHGPLEAVAERLGIANSRTKFWNEHPTIFQIIAPLPLAFGQPSQTTDGTRVQIAFRCGTRIRPELSRITLEPLDGSGELSAFTLPHDGVLDIEAPQRRKATFNIAYCGRHIQRRTFPLHPHRRLNPRLLAHTAFERTSLLVDGLDPKVGRPNEKDADAFERSVTHVLGLLGFSASWWGPPKGGLKVPQEQADILAWSADDSLVLVVDCTLDAASDVKSVKVGRRARELDDALKEKLGHARPQVEPVLAIAVPRSQIPPLLRRSEEGDEITVLALDDIHAVLAAMERGQTHAEIAAALPEPLGAGFRSPPRYALVEDPFA